MKKKYIICAIVVSLIVLGVGFWRYMSTRNDFPVGYYLYSDGHCVHLSPECSNFRSENGAKRITLKECWFYEVDDLPYCIVCVDNKKYKIIMKKCIQPQPLN